MEKQSEYFRISENYKFVLFVSGMSVKSLRAVENLKAIGETYFKDEFDLQIVDISTHPHLAAKHQVIAVPTLIKTSPAPTRVIVGDMSDTNKILKILDIID